ncbi:hypothetical protein N7488_007798 [Penicillium malachiteum]|nr:hypothetical protein N7488_007798 [Penicillium malachiteum]
MAGSRTLQRIHYSDNQPTCNIQASVTVAGFDEASGQSALLWQHYDLELDTVAGFIKPQDNRHSLNLA